ncbi:class I SAM-dependent methyltransferase [Methanoplanus endosymbiosus]|uniref:Class I SAM-dependent methyltransferase n=1 Tax=Methanoplanus endosymbiosus TaxID=33865 RepID=A0A9E7TLI8_9EURY|nr:class I SAM-dependent methyltransferase [Methanoplanus endosymbiosus]UUX92386.1 class I SAM-dependent methyltransferase [Methanoplanus endosymbiosus]
MADSGKNHEIAGVYPDYNEIWKRAVRLNNSSKGTSDCVSHWRDKESVYEFIRSDEILGGERIKWVVESLGLKPGDRVLDIGAGPGTISLEIAKVCSHLTAVEPSDVMAEVFKERACEAGISDYNIVQKRWEDIIPGKDIFGMYDIVISSFALGMEDLRDSLIKMNQVCRGSVHIYYHANPLPWEDMRSALWKRLHGIEYVPVPKADLLMAVLYQLGIYPDLSCRKFVSENDFGSEDEMASFYASKMRVTDDAGKKIIVEYLLDIADYNDNNGQFVIEETGIKAHLWWNFRH